MKVVPDHSIYANSSKFEACMCYKVVFIPGCVLRILKNVWISTNISRGFPRCATDELNKKNKAVVFSLAVRGSEQPATLPMLKAKAAVPLSVRLDII